MNNNKLTKKLQVLLTEAEVREVNRVILNEALETTKIHSVVGRVKDTGLMAQRPFRSTAARSAFARREGLLRHSRLGGPDVGGIGHDDIDSDDDALERCRFCPPR